MGHRYNFLNYYVFLPLKVVLTLANSADSDEMQHYAAFCLGLHCLSKGYQYTKGKNIKCVNIYYFDLRSYIFIICF